MNQSRIQELRLQAEFHLGKRKSAAIIIECLDEIVKLQKRRDAPKFVLSDVMKAAEKMGWAEGLAEQCNYFYEQGGWRYGRGNTKPIVRLEAAMRTWLTNHNRFSRNGNAPVSGKRSNHGVA